MKIFRENRRCYETREYIQYLNKMVAESAHKEKLTDDDKLARVLLFNLEHYTRYGQEKGLTFTMYILDHFTEIVQDKDDAFQRRKIELHIPPKVKRNLFREYREYISTIETIVSATDEELAQMIENGEIEVAKLKEEGKGENTTVAGDAADEEDCDEDEM